MSGPVVKSARPKMARTKSFPRKHSRPLLTANTLLGLSYVICLTRRVASTSRTISLAISTLQAHPLKRPLPATVESLLDLMSSQVTSLYALGFSPYLFPRSARDRAHAWAEDFEIELEGHRDRLQTLVCEREDAEWVLDLFAEFDRGGEGPQLAVGIGEWRDLVEEVFEDVLEERYDISVDDIAEDATASDAQASGADRTAEVVGVPHQVEDITDDAVATLHVLAEGYTSWFCGLAQDATDACAGQNMELDWDSWQLVKAQWAISGLSSDECMQISMRDAAVF